MRRIETVSYFFGLAAAAADELFFFCAAVALSFCAACLLTDFGDLSPIVDACFSC